MGLTIKEKIIKACKIIGITILSGALGFYLLMVIKGIIFMAING